MQKQFIKEKKKEEENRHPSTAQTQKSKCSSNLCDFPCLHKNKLWGKGLVNLSDLTEKEEPSKLARLTGTSFQLACCFLGGFHILPSCNACCKHYYSKGNKDFYRATRVSFSKHGCPIVGLRVSSDFRLQELQCCRDPSITFISIFLPKESKR